MRQQEQVLQALLLQLPESQQQLTKMADFELKIFQQVKSQLIFPVHPEAVLYR